MSQIDRNIAYNLKRIRKSRNLSLDMLAEKTGVSKSMLGQIERGESNPTVTTVSKIMEGIKIPFEDLIYTKEENILSVTKESLSVYKEKEGEYKIQVVFPYSRERSFELFALELESGCNCKGNVCGDNTWAYLTSHIGSMSVTVDNVQYQVEEGGALRFPAFKDYIIRNTSTQKSEGQLILSRGEGGA